MHITESFLEYEWLEDTPNSQCGNWLIIKPLTFVQTRLQKKHECGDDIVETKVILIEQLNSRFVNVNY